MKGTIFLYKLNYVSSFVKEWYCDYEDLKICFPESLEKKSKILILGNGLSTIGLQLAQDGYQDITCIDISKAACEIMSKYTTQVLGKTDKLQFLEMDAKDLKFEQESFDFVFDKGLVDAFWKTEFNDQFSQTMDIEQIKKIEQEIYRVLRKGSFWMIFSAYDLVEEEVLDERSEEMWTKIEDARIVTKNGQELRVYRLMK